MTIITLIALGIASIFMLGVIVSSFWAYTILRDKIFLAFSILFLFSLLIEWMGFGYSYFTRKSNHFIFNISMWVDLLFYNYWFLTTEKNKILHKIVILIASLSITFALINGVFIQGFFKYNTYTYYAESFVIILFCIFHFYSIIKEETIVYPLRNYIFLINTGLFFYFVGTITYFLLWDYMVTKQVDVNGKIILYIQFVLDLVEYIFFIMAFLMAIKWKKTKLY